jgi:hypothetical protein
MADMTLLSNYMRSDDFASADLSQFNFGRVFQAGALALLGLACSTGKAQGVEQKPTNEEIARFQSENNDATPVQLGVLTPTQRIHGKVFSGYGHKPLDEVAASARAEGRPGVAVTVHGDRGYLRPPTQEEILNNLVQSSDSIICGTGLNKTSQLSEDNKFIYTDYQVLVSDVIKGNGRELVKGHTIVVTQPGGKVLLNGIIIIATVNEFLPLSVDGAETLLFLNLVRESGAYKVRSGYELREGRIRALGIPLPQGVIRTRDSLLATVRAISAKH